MATPHPRARYGAASQAGLTGKLPTPYPRPIGPNAMRYLAEVVESGLQCDMVGRFERAFAAKMGMKHCVATPGCTPALAVLAAAFGFEPGDEVIVSGVTDYGTIQGLVREHYIPVFADTAPGTVNVSAETIAGKISSRTRAILVVHKTGLMCDMDAINALAAAYGLVVYEDACQAIFSRARGRFAGSLGLAGAFSFDSEKTLGSDIGGCLVTNDDALAERARFLGQSRGAQMAPGFGRMHVEPGYAYRMTLCTAALCLAQLEVIDENVAQRDRMARLLTRLLAEIPGVTPLPIPPWQETYSCWMFSFTIDPQQFRCDAAEFARQVAEAGIPGAGLGKYYLMPAACPFLQERAAKRLYPYSMPPASRSYRYGAEACPRAAAFLENWVRWVTFCEKYQPEHCEMAAEIVARVARANRR